MTRFLTLLERQPRSATIVTALLIVILVGVIDYLTGYEISLSVFYLVAIALATWYVGRSFGWAVSVLSVISWLVGDVAAGATYANRFVPIWNVGIALVSYLVIVEVLWNLRALQNQLEAKVMTRTAALSEEMTKRQELEKELLEVGERERRRIGHDLHDSLCQHLTGTALAGEVLGEKLTAKALPEEADARRVVTLIEEAITLARNLARGLAPVELEAEGLMSAFRELARTTTERFSIDCRFEAPHPVLVNDSAISAHLFRIAQEAVSNAIKHGHAARVTIGLFLEGDEVTLEVRDNGGGFREPSPKSQGMGLHIMRHRAMMIGATLAIQRQDTRNGANLPLAQRRTSRGRMITHPEGKRRVFLVDDHPLVREWLTNLINQQKDLVVCGEAEDAPQALRAIESLQPDAAVVDVTLANGSGIELVKDVKRVAPEVAVVMLSMHDESLYAERALRAGARGYVMKKETTKKIITAIRTVLEGRLYASDEFKASLTEKLLDGKAGGSPMDALSDRELEVFRRLGQGQETRRIADALGISIKTVQVYCARIKEKLSLANATELLREAMRWWESQNQN